MTKKGVFYPQTPRVTNAWKISKPKTLKTKIALRPRSLFLANSSSSGEPGASAWQNPRYPSYEYYNTGSMASSLCRLQKTKQSRKESTLSSGLPTNIAVISFFLLYPVVVFFPPFFFLFFSSYSCRKAKKRGHTQTKPPTLVVFATRKLRSVSHATIKTKIFTRPSPEENLEDQNKRNLKEHYRSMKPSVFAALY